mgnify:FL=1
MTILAPHDLAPVNKTCSSLCSMPRPRRDQSRITFGTAGLKNLDAPAAVPIAADGDDEDQRVQQQAQQPAVREGGSTTLPFAPSWSAWAKMKRDLFSRDRPAVRSALNAVDAWYAAFVPTPECRHFPPYILATAAVVGAQSLDSAYHDENDPERQHGARSYLSQSCIKLAYAGAITRLVQEMVQAPVYTSVTGNTASTYRNRAELAGIPQEVVEARNLVAHGRMPSLTELRLASALALQYLWNDCWQEQEIARRAVSASAHTKRPREPCLNKPGSPKPLVAGAMVKEKPTAPLLSFSELRSKMSAGP